MFADTCAARSHPGEPHEKRLQPACPVCTGPLVLLGNLWRCGRCCFTLCEGCEGAPAILSFDQTTSQSQARFPG
jgi:hypothetical protein